MNRNQKDVGQETTRLDSLPPTAPHPARVSQVRSWLVDRAISPPAPAAAISIIVTDGDISSDSIGIEPEYFAIIRAELHRLLARLAACPACQRESTNTVIPIN